MAASRWFRAGANGSSASCWRGISRTVNGIPLRVDPVGRHVFTSIYDEGAAACLRTYLREGMEAWNVGANIGVYVLQLAHHLGASGRVVAFDSFSLCILGAVIAGIRVDLDSLPPVFRGSMGGHLAVFSK